MLALAGTLRRLLLQLVCKCTWTQALACVHTDILMSAPLLHRCLCEEIPVYSCVHDVCRGRRSTLGVLPQALSTILFYTVSLWPGVHKVG